MRRLVGVVVEIFGGESRANGVPIDGSRRSQPDRQRISYTHLGASGDLSSARHFETFSQDYVYGRRDFKEVVTARAEKRSPDFTGE